MYLDWNATTPAHPGVIEAMREALSEGGNPSSPHASGRRARARIEAARAIVARAVGAEADDVTFTSGGTEANRLALGQAEGRIAVSAIEHPSVLEAVPGPVVLPVGADGRVDGRCSALDGVGPPAMVSVMLANNETGIVQPVGEVAARCRALGIPLHVDAVQGLGKVPVDIDALGADLLTISAHKVGGPPGVGALVCRAGRELRPLQRGGGQERRRRAGTENLPGIVGFARAIELLDAAAPARMRRLREMLEVELEAVVPGARVVGAGVERLPNTSCITLPGVRAETQLMALDLDGVMVGAGAACSSGKIGASHVLVAMGLGGDQARCAIRVSLGWSTTEADVELFIASFSKLVRRLRPRVSLARGALAPT